MSKVWAFCGNVIIECPLDIILLSIFFTCELFLEKESQQRNQLGQKKKVNKGWEECF